MDKKQIIKNFFSQPAIRDYTYAALFFLVSSFFAFFAIRPSLTIAFSLQREAFDLKKINQLYENNIIKVIGIQSKIETIRSGIHLLDESVPKAPAIKTLIDNIKQVASEEGVLIKNLSLSSIDLKNESKDNQLKFLSLHMETEGDFPIMDSFMKKIISQRRLKTFKQLQIVKFEGEGKATESANLKFTTEIEGYYL